MTGPTVRTCSVPFFRRGINTIGNQIGNNLAYLPADPINVAGAAVLALDVNGVVS